MSPQQSFQTGREPRAERHGLTAKRSGHDYSLSHYTVGTVWAASLSRRAGPFEAFGCGAQRASWLQGDAHLPEGLFSIVDRRHKEEDWKPILGLHR